MKKSILAIAAAFLLLAAVSCKKEQEGVFNPSSKITAIYQEENIYEGDSLMMSSPKSLSEEWVWSDNRLEKITYYATNDWYDSVVVIPVGTQIFKYDDDGRIIRSDIQFDYYYFKNDSTSAYIDYEYDGKYLKSISFYEDGTLAIGCTFTHDGSTITALTLAINEDYKKAADKNYARFLSRINPLRFVLAPDVAEKTLAVASDCAKKLSKKGVKGTTRITLNAEWSGDNLTHLSGSLAGMVYIDFAFEYDSHKNPYRGFFDMVGPINSEVIVPYMAMGKNNVVKASMTELEMGDAYSETIDYTYTYNKNDYPATKSTEDVDDTDWDYDEETGEWIEVTLENPIRYVTTLFYEY